MHKLLASAVIFISCFSDDNMAAPLGSIKADIHSIKNTLNDHPIPWIAGGSIAALGLASLHPISRLNRDKTPHDDPPGGDTDDLEAGSGPILASTSWASPTVKFVHSNGFVSIFPMKQMQNEVMNDPELADRMYKLKSQVEKPGSEGEGYMLELLGPDQWTFVDELREVCESVFCKLTTFIWA